MKTVSKILKVVSIILVLVFVGLVINDYVNVYPYGSAPFYVYVLVRIIELIIPSTICFVSAKLLDKRYKNN